MRIVSIDKVNSGTMFTPPHILLGMVLGANDNEDLIYSLYHNGTAIEFGEHNMTLSLDENGKQITTEDKVSLIIKEGMGVIPKKVIFNNPATIVFWNDDTKTVVKAQDGEKYDKEKGLAMCIVKKALGNKGNYYDVIKRWID